MRWRDSEGWRVCEVAWMGSNFELWRATAKSEILAFFGAQGPTWILRLFPEVPFKRVRKKKKAKKGFFGRKFKMLLNSFE